MKLRRLLCSVLVAAVLLGAGIMSVSTATTFKDAADITYIDAVNATTELGLFAGSDGKFMPKQSVTRAQMATIIVKMLKGSDFNANDYKGASNPFPDTADYQGGWAEGYINVCAQLGVIKGYGDGTFKPDNKVNAAEAVTMIINALKIDTGSGSWPDTYMAKAEELDLFGVISPKPGAYDTLVRDQLAVIVLKGVEQLEKKENPQAGNSGTTSGGTTSGGSNKPSGGTASGGSNKPSGGTTSGGSGGLVVKPSDGTGSGGSSTGGTTSGDVSSGGADTETPKEPDQNDTPAQDENETPIRPGTGESAPETPEEPSETPEEQTPGPAENETPMRPVGPNETPWG